MKKSKILWLVVCLIGSCWLAGCGLKESPMDKVSDLAFTIVPEEEVPKEFREILEEKKYNPMQLTFLDEDSLYLAVGYGMQKTTGYSIGVEELYLAENAICLDTTLIGPGQEEKVTERETYPYVVLKTEAREEPVVFQ